MDPRRMPVANTVVVADNLPVLRALPDGCVDLIYIDPPYNTGHALAYRDTVGSAGGGADRHRRWTAMLRPRLEQARRVLAPTGAIYLSIDDHEQVPLRLLADEVFGPSNLLSQIVVNLNPKGRQLGSGFATSHEYLLVYAADARRCVLDPTSTQAVDPADFGLVDPDGGLYRLLPLRNTNKKFNPRTSPTLHFPLYADPETGQVRSGEFAGSVRIDPVFGDGGPAVWRWSVPLIDQRAEDLVCRRVRGRLGERWDIFQIDRWHPQRRRKLTTIWLAEEVGSTDTGVREVKELIGRAFDSPKPTGLIRRILGTMPDDAVVLDFFAGSGTTGHAVVLANREDGGSRRCLSVNRPEPLPARSPAAQAGFATVAEITVARLEAVDREYGGGLEVVVWEE